MGDLRRVKSIENERPKVVHSVEKERRNVSVEIDRYLRVNIDPDKDRKGKRR